MEQLGPYPREVVVEKKPLSKAQRAHYDKACSQIDSERITERLVALTNIHSPTGAEGPASRFLVDTMSEAGMESHFQEMGSDSGNAIGRFRGRGGGPSVLLYEPVDTHLEATVEEDIPWVGSKLRQDMLPRASRLGDIVIGLGASNPKAMIVTMLEVASAIRDADVPLLGDLIVAFASGGMPWCNEKRDHRGLSDGVTHMLMNGVSPDFAIVMKPWNVVFYEEPGLCWFKVSVKGTFGYAGIPHGTPGFDSSIVPAAKVILAIQEWLPRYVERNTSGQIEPWGWISAVRSGWPEKPAFPAAVTEIYLDVRCSPRTTPAEVSAQFSDAIEEIRQKVPGVEIDWNMTAGVPGGSTDPGNWIIQSAMRAWEHVEGKPHGPAPYMAGQTDGATLRRLGIPTARIGWPWPYEGGPEELAEGLGGMGVTYIPDLVVAARKILYSVIDTCTRTRDDVGL